MSDAIAIRAEGLSKRYRLGMGGGHDSLRDLLAGGAKALLRGGGPKTPRPDFYALKDASFEIKRGENVGLIGANGAGKSTLLKVLSRITEPTAGRAFVTGRVGALLEVGTGFHQELSGRENVYLYGAILGMGRKEIDQKYDEIVDFAEIEQFIDTPVKHYSSGMYVRLAFAVAAHLRPDILLLDEVLAVGDAAFQRKCMAFARELQKREATIVFVSHNMFSIKAMCSRVIVVQKGQIQYDGPTDPGIELYERAADLSAVWWAKSDPSAWPIIMTNIMACSESGVPQTVFDRGDRMKIRLAYTAREPIESPRVLIAIMRADGVGATVYANEPDGVDLGRLEGDGVIEMLAPPLKLIADKYTIHVVVRARASHDTLCAQVGRTFHVRHPVLNDEYGVFTEQAEWSTLPAPAPVDTALQAAGP
ncbi:MAG: ABC transporter ATP-binding protein [Alphaproteobacteria bacterium]